MGSKFNKLKEMLTLSKPEFAEDKDIEGRAEALGQGAFGLGDEIGAGMQAFLHSGLQKHDSPMEADKDFKDTYNQALSENRANLHRQQEREPIRSGALEAFGSLATLPLVGGKAVQAANDLKFAANGVAAPLKAGLSQAMAGGAIPAALYGFGTGEGDRNKQSLRTLASGALGALGGGALRVGANAISRVPAIRNVLAKLQQEAIQSRTAPGLEEIIGDVGGDLRPNEALAYWGANRPSQVAGTISGPDTRPSAQALDDLLTRLIQEKK